MNMRIIARIACCVNLTQKLPVEITNTIGYNVRVVIDAQYKKPIRTIFVGNLFLVAASVEIPFAGYWFWLGLSIICYGIWQIALVHIPYLKIIARLYHLYMLRVEGLIRRHLSLIRGYIKKYLPLITLFTKKVALHVIGYMQTFFVTSYSICRKTALLSVKTMFYSSTWLNYQLSRFQHALIQHELKQRSYDMKRWNERRLEKRRIHAEKEQEQEEPLGLWGKMIHAAGSPAWYIFIFAEVITLVFFYLALVRFLNAHSGFEMFLVWQGLQ